MKMTGYLYIAAALAAGIAVYVVITRAPSAAGNALNAVNPLNHDNVISQAANSVYTAATGDSINTLGTAVADLVDRLTTNSGAVATAPSIPKNSGKDFPAPDFDSVGGPQGFII